MAEITIQRDIVDFEVGEYPFVKIIAYARATGLVKLAEESLKSIIAGHLFPSKNLA